MKTQEFIDALPDLDQCAADGDKWAIIFFSASEDRYKLSTHLDSGDALIVIQELIDRHGIHPDVLASMQSPAVPFDVTFPDGGRMILGNPKRKSGE